MNCSTMENTDNIDSCIHFVRITDDAIIPARATGYSAGFDLYSTEDVTIVGGAGTYTVPTGIGVRLPDGTYGRLAMRSGLAVSQHLSISAGVIDRDYTGEIKVLVSCNKVITKRGNKAYSCFDIETTDGKYIVNPHVYTIKKGERFAQLVIEKVSEGRGEVATLALQSTGYMAISAGSPYNITTVHSGFGSTGKM